MKSVETISEIPWHLLRGARAVPKLSPKAKLNIIFAGIWIPVAIALTVVLVQVRPLVINTPWYGPIVILAWSTALIGGSLLRKWIRIKLIHSMSPEEQLREAIRAKMEAIEELLSRTTSERQSANDITRKWLICLERTKVLRDERELREDEPDLTESRKLMMRVMSNRRAEKKGTEIRDLGKKAQQSFEMIYQTREACPL